MRFNGVNAAFSRFVTHKGVLLCFSYVETVLNPGKKKIGYSVLRVDEAGHKSDDLWSDFEIVKFPNQIRPVGMQVITLKTNDKVDIAAPEKPFQVISDSQYVYLFRQSTAGTLLVDRFVLDEVMMKLDLAWEVRFRRSQKVDLPADRKDTFGSTSMDGERFVEATTELTMIANIENGGFGVQILPTDVASVERWLILARNSLTNEIDNWSLLRSANGMFDLSDAINPVTKDVQPRASYAAQDASWTFASGPAVLSYQRQEWLDDNQGVKRLYKRSSRVMAAVRTSENKTAILDFAVSKDGRIAAVHGALPIAPMTAPTTALALNGGHQTAVTVGDLGQTSTATKITFECWVRVSAGSSGCRPIMQSTDVSNLAFLLATLDGAPVFRVTVGGVGGVTKIVAAPRLEIGQWTHLGAVYDGATATIYVNGEPYGASAVIEPRDLPTAPNSGYRFGGAGGFSGHLKEARLWNIARSRAQILAAMMGVIESTDPAWGNLVGYWRMDEPAGATAGASRLTIVPNSASSGVRGDGVLVGANWTASNAPTAPSMRPVAWDANNLDVATGLLDFALSDKSPCLQSGSDGSIGLYLKQLGTGNLIAAHFNTLDARARYSIPWTAMAKETANNQTGLLHFLARTPGTGMINKAVAPAYVEVMPDAVTDAPPTGKITFRSDTGLLEEWPHLPLEIEALSAIVNGNALQTTPDPVAAGENALMYDYDAVRLTGGPVQKGVRPAPGIGSNIFSALPSAAPTNGYPGILSATAAAILTRAGIDSWWTPAPAAAALTLDYTASVEVLNATALQSYPGPLQMTRDLSIEAWLSPTAFISGKQSTVVLFNNPSPRCNYLLGLDEAGRLFAGNDQKMARVEDGTKLTPDTWTHVAATYVTDYGINLSGTQYLAAGADTSLDTPEALTIEGWVKLDPPVSGQAPKRQTIAAKADGDGQTWALYFDADGKPTFEVTCGEDAGSAVARIAGPTLSKNVWYHVAAVYDVAYKRQTVVQFNHNKGSNIVIPAPTHPLSGSASAEAWIQVGAYVDTAQQVFAFTPLELFLSSNLQLYFLCGSRFAAYTAAPLRPGDWTHVVGVYDAAAKSLSIYVNGQLKGSVENFTPQAPTDSVYRMGAPVGKGPFGGLMSEVRLWNRALSVDEVRQNMMRQLGGGERGLVGYWPLSDRYGTTVMDLAGNATGVINDAVFVQSDKGFFSQRLRIATQEVNGQHVGNSRHVTALPVISEAPVSLGANNLEDFLHGTLDDVRLWKVGRLDWQLDEYRNNTLPRDSEGLISEWAFSTGKGRVAFDSKSENNAIIQDAGSQMTDAIADLLWKPTAFQADWRLFVNGQEAASKDYGPAPPILFGLSQCRIGGTRTNDTTITNSYSGSIAELRLWNRVLTAEQIRDRMYGPLAGDEDHLTGYWPMDDGSGTIVADRTGSGADAKGTWQGLDHPEWITSGAPVGIEAPQVQSVPGGLVRTGLQAKINDTPAVADYADVELDAEGESTAAMKRAYAYVSPNTLTPATSDLNADTGYKVGDLEMQYIGQVQTKPTLIGYIEGAPPLPSENLTVDSPVTPYKYLGASAITLTESDNTTVSYSAQRELGDNYSQDYKAGLGIEWDFRAGIVVQSLLIRGAVKAGFHMTDQKALATLTEANISTSTNAVMAKSIEVFGAWQTNTYDFDRLVGRLYVPNNMGYALVKSGTADYYAIRLKKTGTVLKYAVQPNPDIPEDTNIIMFKINPLYVKNGTLDGHVGFQTDESYPRFPEGEKGSYFKPIEAYALKQQIDREHQHLLAAYDQFDATGLGRLFQFQLSNTKSQVPSGGYRISDAGTNLTGALLQIRPSDAGGSDEWKERMARRNLVNTYVWNSDGGLYSEEEQFSAVHEESLGGSYELVNMKGGYAEFNMSTGPQISLDVLTGTIIRTKAMKRKTEGESFGLTVKMPGEGFLNQRADPTTMSAGEYPVTYMEKPCPGKVNQYRFMTFYLAPKKSNFETFWTKVVDQKWLDRQGDDYAGTDDPDAFALRQAKANPNDVWRVLHRVTYVNRIPPLPGEKGDPESTALNVRRPDDHSIAQNIWLIADLPVPSQDPTPLGTVYQELQPLLAKLGQNKVWGDLLIAQKSVIASDIMDYMRGYYEVPA